MVAPCVDGAATELDRKRTVPVCAGEGALVQDVQCPVPVGFLCRDADPVLDKPLSQVDCLSAPGGIFFRFYGGCDRERGGQGLQELAADPADFGRHVQEHSLPVRPVRGVVALPRGSAIELPDPGGVKVGRVDCADAIGEDHVQGLQRPLHKVAALVIVLEVDPIQEMRSISGVCQDRRRPPAFPAEIGRNLGRPDQCRLVLLVG
ncbi:MAG: hypothetical protein A4E41_00856 [Methanoregulaceae archaeon PtaU1.Bin066]|nr:MAG: hypothetical protein A4E41_00856 [Methanoregulaceae archaeon PtaU1.Bin066]